MTQPLLYQQRLSGEPKYLALQGCNKVAQNPSWDGVREGQVGSWNFHFQRSEMQSCPSQVSVETMCGKVIPVQYPAVRSPTSNVKMGLMGNLEFYLY